MLRAWPLLLCLAGLSWMARLFQWVQTGFLLPLTVGDVAAGLGLGPWRPPATPVGDVLAAVLGTDSGLFCLLLAIGGLLVDALAPKRCGH